MHIVIGRCFKMYLFVCDYVGLGVGLLIKFSSKK